MCMYVLCAGVELRLCPLTLCPPQGPARPRHWSLDGTFDKVGVIDSGYHEVVPAMSLAAQKLKLGIVPKATLECCLSRDPSYFIVLQPAPATARTLKSTNTPYNQETRLTPRREALTADLSLVGSKDPENRIPAFCLDARFP